MDKKTKRRKNIHLHIRQRINGTGEKPRLSVFRSNKEIYAQLIDDEKGFTLASASSRAKGFSVGSENKTDISKKVGRELAAKAESLGIKKCVFDRSGYLYHGRVKALSEGAREGGLQF